MISLEDVRKQNKLTLQELGMAINSLWINPNQSGSPIGLKIITSSHSRR